MRHCLRSNNVQGVPGQVTRLWSYVQGRVFNTFSWLISQIKAEGWANRLVESHFWCSHFWRENSKICYNTALQTAKFQMRRFLIVLKHFEIVHTNFEDSTLYIASKTYPLARNTLYNIKVYQMHHLEFYSLKHGMVGNIWIFAPKMAASKMWFYQSICPSFGFTLRYYPMKCIENSALDIASKSGHLGWDTL